MFKTTQWDWNEILSSFPRWRNYSREMKQLTQSHITIKGTQNKNLKSVLILKLRHLYTNLFNLLKERKVVTGNRGDLHIFKKDDDSRMERCPTVLNAIIQIKITRTEGRQKDTVVSDLQQHCLSEAAEHNSDLSAKLVWKIGGKKNIYGMQILVYGNERKEWIHLSQVNPY